MDGCARPVEDGASAAGLNLGFQISKSRVKGKANSEEGQAGQTTTRKPESSNFSFDDFNLHPSDDDKRKSDKENRDRHGEGLHNGDIASNEHKSPSKNDRDSSNGSAEDDDYDFSRRGLGHASFFSDDTASNVESGGSKVDDDELSISKELNLKAQLYAALEGGDSTSTSDRDTSRPNSRQHVAGKGSSASSRPNSNASKSEAIDFALIWGRLDDRCFAPRKRAIEKVRSRGEYSRKDAGHYEEGARHKRHGREIEVKGKGKEHVEKEWLQVKTRCSTNARVKGKKSKTSPSKGTKDTWEEEAEVSLQKRLDGLLKSTTASSPSKATPRKKSAVEGLKTAHRINPSPITKTEDNIRKKRGSGTAVRAKHRVRSAKVSRGSQRNNPFMGSKDREMRKSRHKSANIVEHRKRMKKIWEQHHNLQRPPSRQRTPFPTHLAEFEFKRFKAFGKNQEVKSKVPTDPIAKSQIMQARKFAEESTSAQPPQASWGISF